MSLIHLLRLVTFNHLRLQKMRGVLSICGIALGVSVLVSVQIAIHTSIESFNATVDHISGKANLQVTSYGRGFAEETFLKVKKISGVKAATPIIEFVAKLDEPIGEPIYLLGIDIFSDQPFREYRFEGSEEDHLKNFKLPASRSLF